MSRAQCGFDDGDTRQARSLLIRIGPTLKVDVGFDPDYDASRPALLAQPGVRDVGALIDTGASISCVDSGLAMDLRLPIINRAEVAGVGGTHQFNVHLCQIHSPDLGFTFYGGFAGVDLAAGGQTHTVLIGRDFLSHFQMTYDGPSGAVTLVDPTAPLQTEIWPDE
jgi:hypothetical protein